MANHADDMYCPSCDRKGADQDDRSLTIAARFAKASAFMIRYAGDVLDFLWVSLAA